MPPLPSTSQNEESTAVMPDATSLDGLVLPSAGDELKVKWRGVSLALIAFAWTRFQMVEALYGTTGGALHTTILPLALLSLGLAIVVYGVNLAVSTHSPTYVNTVFTGYLLGTVGMVALAGGSMLGAGHALDEIYHSSVFTSSVVGGGIAGITIGHFAARTAIQRRSLDRHRDRSVLLNRLLRHEILNSLTAIQGHSSLLAAGKDAGDSAAAVESNSDRIEDTIEEVGWLVRTPDQRAANLRPVDLDEVLMTCRDRFQTADTGIRFTADIPSLSVRGDDHLDTVFAELLTAARDRASGQPISVTVTDEITRARVQITATGDWLNQEERKTLQGTLPKYDSPQLGYGLSISRLLVDLYGGRIEVTRSAGDTQVDVLLPQLDDEQLRPRNSPGVDGETLQYAVVAGLVSGIAMGVVLLLSSGNIALIGGLYGFSTQAAGWVTHVFHSVVFAILFAAVEPRVGTVTRRPRTARYFKLGIAYSLLLWLVAGGVVMGVWLNAVGIPSPVPDLGIPGLVGHLSWGISLAAAYQFVRHSAIFPLSRVDDLL